MRKVFELSEMVRSDFLDGIRRRYPAETDQEIHQLMLERLGRCHNRNY